MSRTVTLSLVLVSITSNYVLVSSYPMYQTFIPNGNRVPNPCDRASVWQGVGHQNPAGAGVRNPFGLDFAANGHDWASVCKLDSDGDGRTNGEELGDYNCTWIKGQPAPDEDYISHPGVCEPLDDDKCIIQNSWLTCPPPFNCPAIDEPGVMNMSFRMPQTTVPSQQTTYMCYGFVLPNDTDYHIIAFTPIITNVVVVHHIAFYVCTNPPLNPAVFSAPTECPMDAFGCTAAIAGWTAGINGVCNSNEFGFRIGPNGYHYAVIQVHWNNAYWKSGAKFVDSSGLTLYYTTNLRPHDATSLMVGQNYLNIPPQQQSVSFTGVCSSRCTSALPGPINIAISFLHMHLIGQSGDILITRNDGSVEVLMNVTAYNYYSPNLQIFTPPVQFQPGDGIRVDCNYNSMSRTNTTMSGMSTSDEMCYGFLIYYPAVNDFDQCIQWRSVDTCLINGGIYSSCDMMTMQMVAATLPQVCMPPIICSPSCTEALQQIADTGCLSGDIMQLLQANDNQGMMSSLLGLMQMCSMQPPTTPTPNPTPTPISSTTSSARAAAFKCRKRNRYRKRCRRQKKERQVQRKAYGVWVIG